MRLTEFAEKRIINIYDGELLGAIGESDLQVDPESGQLLALLLPPVRRGDKKQQISVAWDVVKRVGTEVVVVDVDLTSPAEPPR